MFKKMHDERPACSGDYQRVSAEDWARYRIEMTRREISRLLAAVELGTEYGARLSAILEDALIKIEALAEDAHAGDGEACE